MLTANKIIPQKRTGIKKKVCLFTDTFGRGLPSSSLVDSVNNPPIIINKSEAQKNDQPNKLVLPNLLSSKNSETRSPIPTSPIGTINPIPFQINTIVVLFC